jgi:transcriptional regulator with XRE-family HTH domain
MNKDLLITLLRQIRVEANLTQLQVAERLGHAQSYVSKYETGEQRLDLIELDAICAAVGVPLLKFIERVSEA